MTANGEQLLADLRPTTFAVAYRMLGSVATAEDVVQETLLRVHEAIAAGQAIQSPRAFAATVATRLSIDELRSARVRRERYVGEWLPEPVIGDDATDDPAAAAELADSLSLAFLVVLEALSPEQRAALLLHDVFDYGYDEVAAIVGTSVDNARQLATRARRHVAEQRPRFDPSQEQRAQLAHRFFAAAREGDLEGLEALLAHDVVLHGDGGGKALALKQAVVGSGAVARFIIAVTRTLPPGATIAEIELNGAPGLVAKAGGRIVVAIMIDTDGERIRSVFAVANPDKLDAIAPVVAAGSVQSR
jgi:RNA polymerase sigma-70 factor (ECF subfamily)